MFNSDLTANRPAAGIVGRIFIAIDSPYGIFRDTGTAWEQVAGAGGGGGIGGSIATGQVAFGSASNTISGTNNLFWDAANNRLGINTASPSRSLDIHGSGIMAVFNGTGTNNAFIVFDNAGANKWRIGNVYSTGTNYFQLFDNVANVTRFRWDNTGEAQLQGYFDFLSSSTNDVATFRASQANVTIRATGATNPVSLTFDPSATYESVIQATNTDGFLQFKTNSLVRNQILNDGKNSIVSTPVISSSAGWYSVNAQSTSTIPAATTFGNLGYVMGSVGGYNMMTYAGSATFAQGNVAASVFGLNSLTFSAGSSTITMNQGAGGIRAITGLTAQNQFSGTNNGTISHLAGIQTLGLYNNNTGTITPTITNYYGLLINSATEYGHTFTITNRWGIYQGGTSDTNYFAANSLFGTTGDTGYKVNVVGSTLLNGLVVFGTYATGVGMYWDNANNYFGIGNTSPQQKLDILGINLVYCKIKSNTNSGASAFQAANDLNNTAEFGMWGSTRSAFGVINSGDGYIYNNVSFAIGATNDIKFGAGSGLPERMRIKSNGQVRFLPLASAPASGQAGDVYYDSTLNKLRVYTTAWETITSI
jgi:hypothetical protein